MNVLDLFSGIGGFSLGLECTGGFKTVAFCEIEPFCRKVLAKHWPDIPIYEDIRELTGEQLGQVDVITGGFPCQDISVAGRGAGIDGDRSGLWREMHRIICRIRPRYVIVENSSALAFRGLGRVLGDLAASGYDTEWQCIPAASVGAPHIRDRIWLLAYPRRELGDVCPRETHGRPNVVLPKRDGWETTERSEDWKLIALAPGVHQRVAADWWRTQSRMARSVDGVPNGTHRVTALGNAVVPQIPELIGRAILEAERVAG